MKKVYRNEEKYIVNEAAFKILQMKLDQIALTDPHQKGESYRIRSLYFDDCYDSAFYENDAGVDERKKIRIRVYDNPKNLIRLEIKHKLRGKNYKEACPISTESFYKILNKELRFDESFPKALRLLYLEMMTKNSEPKVITEYERSTYIYGIGNVRITFDRNISYSNDFNRFLKKNIRLTPLLQKGMHVLEVKYDEFLPDFIGQLIETGDLSLSTFSKYYLSRLAMKGDYYI